MKSISIALVINKLERETRTMEMIKNSILKFNSNAQVKFIYYSDKHFVQKVIEFKPHLVLTFPLTARTLSIRFYILKYLLKFSLISLRTEGLILKCNKMYLSLLTGKEEYGNNLVDHEIFWGPESAKLLGNILLKDNKISSKKRIHFFGAPSFEKYNNPKKLPDNIDRKLKQYTKVNTFIIVTGFQYAEYSKEDILKAGDIVDINSRSFINDYINWLCFLEKCKLFRYMWIHLLDLCAKNNPELLFVVKNHPIEINIFNQKTRKSPYERLKMNTNILLIDEPIPIKDILPKCNVLFHYGSTTMLEAYLNRVPSVYVESKEIRKIEGTINPFEKIDLPSACSIDIDDFYHFIIYLKKNPIQFKRLSKIDSFLERQLNLSLNKEYKPSDWIARFLLTVVNQQPQKIESNDKYLHRSITSGYANHIHQYLLEMSYKNIILRNYREALRDYLLYLEKLLEIQKICITNFYLYKSICFFNMNMLENAIEALNSELQYFPNNKEAKSFYNLIRKTMNYK